MLIRLDLFAKMIGIKPAYLLHVVRIQDHLEGIPLPKKIRRGSTFFFEQSECLLFIIRWKLR